jgi:predicted amidohydrolase YtcJ
MPRLAPAFAAVLALASLGAAPPADLVLVNGKVWTGEKDRPEAEAVAVTRDRITLVGSTADVKALAGPATKVIDLRGRRVVSGFYDSHVHMIGGGRGLSEVALKDAKDEAEFGKRLKEFDAKLPPGRWLTGGNWDHDRAFNGTLPTAALIDRYVPERPVCLSRYDGHMVVVNTKALKLAGVTSTSADPPGGEIFRLADGKTPSGVLRDNAEGLVARLIPPPGEDEVIESVNAALAEARSVGVTSVQDMDGSGAATRRILFRTYQRFARAGKLTTRVDLRWPIGDAKELIGLGVEADFGTDRVRIGGVKGFMDGSLGSSTAKMFQPFVHESKSTGIFVTPRAAMQAFVRAADKAGLSVAVHAIGDEGNATILDIFADAARENGPRDRRFRVEHAQHLRPQDYRRFHDLNVIASMQPYHAIDDGRWAEGRIGKERCASSYAFRSLLDAGAVLAFGSDWPVAPLDPLVGIDAAVNRRTLDGKHPEGWFPEQRITVAEAVTAYTRGSAYAAFQENERGSLKPGKLADLVVLSRDIFAPAERDRIADTKVQLTVVGGAVVFEAKE